MLLISFNRPEHTRKVLEAIMAANPQDLYVFQDGARQGNSSDEEKCAEVRRVVETLTRDCGVRLHTLYSDINLGCGPGPATALNWFFSENEMGITPIFSLTAKNYWKNTRTIPMCVSSPA